MVKLEILIESWVPDSVREVMDFRPRLEGDAGIDLWYVRDPDDGPGTVRHLTDCEFARLSAGVRVKIPDGHFGMIMPRSSAVKRGIAVAQTVIDCGYTGPLFILASSYINAPVFTGERLAQLVIIPSPRLDVSTVSELPETERGSKGFGSTGR